MEARRRDALAEDTITRARRGAAERAESRQREVEASRREARRSAAQQQERRDPGNRSRSRDSGSKQKEQQRRFEESQGARRRTMPPPLARPRVKARPDTTRARPDISRHPTPTVTPPNLPRPSRTHEPWTGELIYSPPPEAEEPSADILIPRSPLSSPPDLSWAPDHTAAPHRPRPLSRLGPSPHSGPPGSTPHPFLPNTPRTTRRRLPPPIDRLQVGDVRQFGEPLSSSNGSSSTELAADFERDPTYAPTAPEQTSSCPDSPLGEATEAEVTTESPHEGHTDNTGDVH